MSGQQTVAITGASGMVGAALTTLLTNHGHRVIPLIRRADAFGRSGIQWNPAGEGIFQPDEFRGIRTLVHLAGENIAAKRWTSEQKQSIRSSRVDATVNLVRSLVRLPEPPTTLVCASAIGWYGDRGEEPLDESSEPGTGFLAEVCHDWEQAAEDAQSAGVRVVHVRIGVVLSTAGGALKKMLTPFRLGLGGVVGRGRQYWSWIGLADVASVLEEAIFNEALSGPVNAVSPGAVTNREFTKVLGKVLRRPTVFPLPAFVAKLMLGEMAEELLLSSTRVIPRRLLEVGFEFSFPDLEYCLRDELK